MNYQLALELKIAGFQFNPNIDWSKRDFFWLPCFEITKDDREKLWIPTLEELIEACGDDLRMLNRLGDHWEAVGMYSKGEHVGKGYTPIEAVARLWLALNKK